MCAASIWAATWRTRRWSRGEIDVYVEYTGTALLAILKDPPVTDPQEVLRRVKAEYARRFKLEWTEPLGFNNTFAILVRADDARQLNLKTDHRRGKSIGSMARRFRPGFHVAGGRLSRLRARPTVFISRRSARWILSLTYRALAEKQVDLIAGNSTDGLISRYGLLQLEDDRHYFPPYDGVPVARQDTLEKHPEVRRVLQQLSGILTVDEMRKLNYAVDGEKRQPREVAREFLKLKNIIQ